MMGDVQTTKTLMKFIQLTNELSEVYLINH